MNGIDPSKTAPTDGEFHYCADCRIGASPHPCTSCRHNFTLIEHLKQTIDWLEKANLELKSEIGVQKAIKNNAGC